MLNIIPCHGEYLSNNDLKESYEYYKIMWEGIKKAKTENKTLENIKSEFALDKKFKDFKSFKIISDDNKNDKIRILKSSGSI